MTTSKAKLFTLALAATLVVGTLGAASARHRKHANHFTSHTIRRDSGESAFWSGIPVENGTPVIMKGYHPPRISPDQDLPRQRADGPVHIPRGSSTYIPPPVPSPYSANSPPASSLTQLPAAQPYRPAPIVTPGDRAIDAIHAFPLQGGIGNNPSDQQQFIRQRVNGQ